MTETRTRWEATEEPPEGWARLNQWIREDGDLDVLFTDDPSRISPYIGPHKFIRYRPIEQTREVSEWRDKDPR